MNKIKLNKNKRINSVFLGLSIIYCIILIFMPIAKGHDMNFHFTRIQALANEIEVNGLFNYPFRIYSTMFNGYGYANPMFYGDIFLLLPATLIASGVKIVTAYKVTLVIVSIGTFVTMYNCAKVISNSKDVAIKAGYMYITGNYLWLTMFERAGLGEVISFMFLPLAITGLYKIINIDKKYCGIIELSFGVTGMLLSHNLSTLIACIFFLIYFILNIKKININIIVKLIIAVVLTLGLTAFFIFPMLEQLLSQKFFVTSDDIAIGKKNINTASLPLLSYFLPTEIVKAIRETYSLLPRFIVGDNRWYPGGTGYLLTFILFIRIFYRHNKEVKKYDKILVATILVVIFISNIISKESLQSIIGFIQFPWRLFMIYTFLISLYVALVLKAVNNIKIDRLLIVVLSISFIICTMNYMYKVIYNEERFEYTYTSWAVGYGEYIPYQVKDIERIKERGNKCISNNSDLVCSYNNGSLIFENNEIEDTWVELPIMYYKGYGTEKNSQEYVFEQSDNGLVKVLLPQNVKNDKVVIKYVGTKVQKISDIISILTIIIVVGYYIKKNLKKETDIDININQEIVQ